MVMCILFESVFFFFFFFNDTATTEIYTLSLHDALPISASPALRLMFVFNYRIQSAALLMSAAFEEAADRKSTRLNSSHLGISYAVFCLKKKRTKHISLSPLTFCIASTCCLV